MLFRTKYTSLTDEQFIALGRLTTSWAILEATLELVLANLSRAPAFPARAIINRLNARALLDALKDLVLIHRERYRCRLVSEKVLDRLETVRKQIEQQRIVRNRLVHNISMRITDDTIYLFRLDAKLTEPLEKLDGVGRVSMKELSELNSRTEEISNELHELLGMIPEAPESKAN